MSRQWSLLCALVTVAIPSRAWAQEPVATIPSFPDSLSCLAQAGTTRGEPQGDAGARDASRARPAAGAQPARSPAIILRASASAREVRFASQPRIQVELCGGVLDSVRVLERRNLPDPVQSGVTYRDVFIAVEILGHLNAECLAERITGRDSTRAGACAGIQLRDSAGTRRPPPP